MSAMGTVLLGRDRNKQGCFPLRGKIINAFGNTREAVFNNQEFQAITQIILGGEYRRNFTLDDVKVSKVIFLSDADCDGANIAALLLRLFVMYFPQLIEAGMVYKAIPPLFSIQEGKKTKFLTEQIDIIQYIRKDFLSKHNFTYLKKKPIESREITKFFLRNTDYLYYLNKTANTYAVDPFLLEMVLYNYVANGRKIDYKKLDKSIKSAYRFMSVSLSKSKVPVVSGTIEASNMIICHDKFFNDCRDILNIIESNSELYYLIDNKTCTIAQVMTIYEQSTPSQVQRYKGLGEMSASALSESTLYPGSNRTLIRYTMEDIKESTAIIREFESNSKKILSEVGLVERYDLID